VESETISQSGGIKLVNIIKVKLSGRVVLGLLVALFAVVLAIGSNPGVAGAEEDISKYNEPWTGIMTYINGGKIVELNQMKNVIENGDRDKFTKEQIGEFFVSNVKTTSRGMGIAYGTGNKEILEINGKPWQETEYRDLILNNLDYYGDSKFRFYPELFEFVVDPNYNDRANEVIEWVKKDKTKAEVEGTIKEIKDINSSKIEEQNNQVANGDNDKADIPAAEGTRVVLEVGSKTISVVKDGTASGIQIDIAPFMKGNSTYIPVKGVFDELGADVKWDGATRTVTIESNKKIQMVPWNRIITVDGEEVQVDNPAIIINGRTFLPVRVVAENLDYDVEWEQETREIIIK